MRRSTAGLRCFIATAVLASLVVPFDSLADSVRNHPSAVPDGYQSDTHPVWTGEHLFLFGYHRGIVRYTPSSNQLTTMNGRMAQGGLASSVWTGSEAFTFGGGGPGYATAAIQRYTPSTDSAALMRATFTYPRYNTSAIWDGTNAYVFGGATSSGSLREVVRYNPSTDTASPMASTLPGRTDGNSAVWTGSYAFIFGDSVGTRIRRYDPVTDTFALMNAVMPESLNKPAVLWDGEKVLIVGNKSIYTYDPVADSIARVGITLVSDRNQAAIAKVGNELSIVGGSGSSQILKVNLNTLSAEVMNESLFTGVQEAAVATDGSTVHVFGGRTCSYNQVLGCARDEITRHDPSTGKAELAGRLPSVRSGAAAAFLNGKYYVIGGFSCYYNNRDICSYMDEIVVFDPSDRSVTLAGITLPSGRSAASAVAAAGSIFIFGGKSCVSREASSCTDNSDILKFDPTANTLVKVGDLPTQRSGTAAVSTGDAIYVIGGGRSAVCEALPDVLKFDPSSSLLSNTGMVISKRTFASALFDGRNIFVTGGLNGCGDSLWGIGTVYNDIIRIDPSTSAVQIMAAKLSANCYAKGAAFAGGRRLLYGGMTSYGVSDLIYGYTLEPGSPSTVAATGGIGQVELSWLLPPSNSYLSPVTGYQIYAGPTSETLSLVAEYPASATSYTESGLGKGVTRYFQIRAINAEGAGALSSVVSGKTWSNPGPPTNARVDMSNLVSVKLLWGPPSNSGGTPVTNYRIYRAGPVGAYSQIAEVGDVRTYTDTKCTGVCRYYISAVNAVGEGSASSVVQWVGGAVP